MSTNTEATANITALAAPKHQFNRWLVDGSVPEPKVNPNLTHPAYPQTPATFGPAYDVEIDGQRLRTQLEKLADFMAYCNSIDAWVSLAEIEEQTGIPQSSASAQLRHMRKREFGSHIVEKRRRETAAGGTWEYRVTGRAYPEEL